MAALGKLGEQVLTGVAALLLVAVIAWFLVPRALNLQPQVVLSGSMEPELQTGAVAFMKPTSAADMQVGDMMTFHNPKDPSIIVTHRVLEIHSGADGRISFVTKGDANEGPDPWVVPAELVKGRVVWDLPHAGRIAERLRSPLGFFLLMALPALYLAVGEVRSIIRELRKRGRSELPA